MVVDFDIMAGDRVSRQTVGAIPNDNLRRMLADLAQLIYAKRAYVDLDLDDQLKIIADEIERRRLKAEQKVNLHYEDDNLPIAGRLYSSDNDKVCYDVRNVVRIVQGEDARFARIVVTYDRMSANRRTLGNRCAGEEFFSKIVSKGL